jgi:Cdc6-like AAA superfamily ATPase
MSDPVLLTPTLHVEVQLSKSAAGITEVHAATRKAVADWLQNNYATAHVGRLDDFQDAENSGIIRSVHVVDYTGPHEVTGYYSLAETKLDVQTYVLRPEQDTGERRSIKQNGDGDGTQARITALPNVVLNEDWDSLVFDDGLPSRLLRYSVRMVAMMGKPGLNLATFNWNKICLLHGPPGSGKSTLCRALAQKVNSLEVRLDAETKLANIDAAQYPPG